MAMRRGLVPVGLALFWGVSGCSAFDRHPDEPYFEACTSDADCAPTYRCMPWSLTGAPRTACTGPCTTASECPPVVTDHCGDLTICHDGVCGFSICR